MAARKALALLTTVLSQLLTTPTSCLVTSNRAQVREASLFDIVLNT